MSADQVLLAATGLLSAVIGAGAVLWAQRAQWRRDRVAAAQDSRSEAVRELIVLAQAIDMRAHELMVISKSLGTPGGVLARLLRAVAPVDLLSVFEAMNREATALNRAAAHLWMSADPETVRLAEDVVEGAARMIEAHQIRSHRNPLVDWLRRAVLGPRLADPEVIAAARRDLAGARQSLVVHLREQADLGALPERPLSTT